ncbi:hypothetical protein PENSPDRAFT_572074 [Peniophora sp. CONT]|nr:hypothetical protein PENSPDRAFT_572074 [Peniophora sp. CONT]
MKFILAPLLLAASTLAQSISIADPADGATLTAGSPMNVELDFPNSLTGVKHVSVVISFLSCGVQPCDMGADQILGNVLYSGNYTPAYTTDDAAKPPNQNFTLTIPSEASTGAGLLNVAHFYLVGASAQPILEYKNISFNLQAPASQRRGCNAKFCL